MAGEAKRGCGYRKVGGLYLVGDYTAIACDRLPYRLTVCPICGAGIKVGRGMTKINPLVLFGLHEPCDDELRPCFVCDPTDEPAYIMRVGEKYYPTPQDFINEGVTLGFSKRIAQIPREFTLGQTIIYLAHDKACAVTVEPNGQDDTTQSDQPKLIEAEEIKRVPGIFSAFIPKRIEKIYWQSDIDKMSDKEKKALARRGITPVGVPDGDKDHW